MKKIVFKKTAVIMLSLAMAAAAAACGGKNQETTAAAAAETAAEKETKSESTAPAEGAQIEPGFYYVSYEEEIDGEIFEGLYYLELCEDGTGTWCVQDRVKVTWDEKGITDEMTTYPAVFENGALTISLGNDASETYKKAEGKIIHPLDPGFDSENMPDGSYPCRIYDVAEDDKGVISLSADIYSMDVFAADDISKLSSGDVIFCGDSVRFVDSVEGDDWITINGGLEEGGIVLYSPDDMDGYILFGFDDTHSYSCRFSKTLEVASDAVFTDDFDINEHIETDAAGFKKSYEEVSDFFFELNTEIEVEDGVVTKIVRNYIP